MSKREKTSTVIRVVVFCVLMISIISLSGNLFVPFNEEDTNQAYTFYNLTDDNSVDVLIAGTSTDMAGVCNNELWKKYGIVSQSLCNSMQSPAVTYEAIKSAYKYQKPKVVIIGMRGVFWDYDYDKYETFVRRGMDFRPLSLTKIKIARYITDRSDKQSLLSYIFPLLRYHSRWSELSSEDMSLLGGGYDYMHGQHPALKFEPQARPDYDKTDDEPVDYSEESWKFYKELAEFCKAQGSEVVFELTPYVKWTRGRSATVRKLADEVGAGLIDMNTNELVEEYGIDFSKDYYDDHHLNLIGSSKVTEYIGKYLSENYDLPNRACSEEKAAQLDKDYTNYMEMVTQFRAEEYDKQ